MAPKNPQSILSDAVTLEKTGDTAGAIRLYKGFLSKQRTHPNALKVRLRTAQLMAMLGRYDDAIQLIEHSGTAGHKNLMLMYTLAQACSYAGRLNEAHEALDRTLSIDPDYPPAIARLTTVLQYQGMIQEAKDTINSAYARGIDSWDMDYSLGQLAPSSGQIDQAADRISKRLTDTKLPNNAAVDLHFILASLLEQQGNYNDAWQAASRANALKSGQGTPAGAKRGQQIAKNLSRYKDRTQKIIDIFDAQTLGSLAPDDAGPEPRNQILMISGMPRSGTTLFEQILGAHPLTQLAGETQVLTKMASDLRMYPAPEASFITALSAKQRTRLGGSVLKQLHEISGKGNSKTNFVIDKHPSNDEHLGLLAAIAPGSRMILTRRDPRDIALSCYFKNFALGHGWTNSMDSIVDMIESRLALHEHWIDVIPKAAPWIGLMVGDYEDFVQDPENQTRKLVEFVGLPWEDACLKFSDRKRIVPTLQPHQAAKGVYSGSLSKWTPYAESMDKSLDRLNRICERFGYSV